MLAVLRDCGNMSPFDAHLLARKLLYDFLRPIWQTLETLELEGG